MVLARTIWYLSKALNYVMKDVVEDGESAHGAVWAHVARLDRAAREMRCSRDCRTGCRSRVHDRLGARSHVVSASRRTPRRSGWSFTGLTRTVQRRLRREWFEAHAAETAPVPSERVEAVPGLFESIAERVRGELVARAAAVP